MYDALLSHARVAAERSRILQQLSLKPGGYALATVHRAANTDDPRRLEAIVDGLAMLREPVVLPMHPRTRAALAHTDIEVEPPVRIIDPVGYLDMLVLEQHARMVLTDSGGVQKEAYLLGVPCVTLRDETEWTETIEDGWNVLAGADTERILAAARRATACGGAPTRVRRWARCRSAWLRHWRPMIHPSADVSPQAVIGERTRIWHEAQVRERARVGDDCILGKGVYIGEDVVVGDRCKIENRASLFPGVMLEDGVFIGPHVVFANDRFPRAVNPDGSLKTGGEWTVEPRSCVTALRLAPATIVLPGITIGPWAMVGAGSVVTANVPAQALVRGNPARVVGWVCVCGRPLRTADTRMYHCDVCDRPFHLADLGDAV